MNIDGKINHASGNRWCAGCNQEHGPLCECEKYDAATGEEVAALNAKHAANLSDPAWCDQQIANGVPPEGIAIFRMFAGL